MSTAPKQQKIAPDAIPATASLPVERRLIPAKLEPWEHSVLKSHYDWKTSDKGTAWFKDSEELRVVLRKYGLMPKEQS